MANLQTDLNLTYLLFGAFIAALAMVQSIFGVGLLIFGTPALLFAGVRFDEVLSVLLPASLSVSVLQIVCDGRPKTSEIAGYFVYMLPALGIGLLVALFAHVPGLDLFICSLLVFAAVLRVSPNYREKLMAFAKRFSRTTLIAIGMVHGMTNMGGSLLEAYVSSRESEKLNIRQSIACGYALLAGSQLIVLASVGRFQVSAATGIAIIVASSVFLTFGRRTFALIHQTRYRVFVSVLMVLAASALIAKRALV